MEESSKVAVLAFLDEVRVKYHTGRATEHAYRPALQALVETLCPEINAVNDPSREDVGAPDFLLVERQSLHQPSLLTPVPLGFIEAKDMRPGILDTPENKKQLERYLDLGNVVHTDNLTFRFYFDRELVKEVTIASLVNHSIVTVTEGFADLAYYLQQIVARPAKAVRSSADLAILMADRARPIRRTILDALNRDVISGVKTELVYQYDSFRSQILTDLTVQEFADIYAQTIAYGLFAARYHDTSKDSFTIKRAIELVPNTNPFLQRFFREIAGYDHEERITWVLENFSKLFNYADVHSLMSRTRIRDSQVFDPVSDFYETFLAEYDPDSRRQHGVYYTPLPVVKFMVRVVDELLKRDFDLPRGLSDDATTIITKKSQPVTKAEQKHGYKSYTQTVPVVQILDPATGTGTFLNEVILRIAEDMSEAVGSGWSSYVEDNLLPRVYGFEFLMAAYAMAHMRLNLTLSDTGYVPSGRLRRLGVYLTNTLLEPSAEHEVPALLGMSRILADEAHHADDVKRSMPIMVVIGNPPYFGHSRNTGLYAKQLIAPYKFEPGGEVPLQERNPKWLNDDYVKFLAYAESLINKSGSGLVAMITNSGYLDNPTFRGMRWHLTSTFDTIYVLDLHGSSRKRESGQNGQADENVFLIEQGVSIIFALKKPQDGNAKREAKTITTIKRADLYGRRTEKFEFLSNASLESIEWRDTPIHPPLLIFGERSTQESYRQWPALNDLFNDKNVGVVTSRDKLVVGFDKTELDTRIRKFYAGSNLDLRESKSFQLDTARKQHSYDAEAFQPFLYRPFDKREIYYKDYFIERSRRALMSNFRLGDNVGLIVPKQTTRSEAAGGFITNSVTGHKTYSAYNINTIFPLYLQPRAGSLDLAALVNLRRGVVQRLLTNVGRELWNEGSAEALDGQIGPMDVLDYIYAVLYSPIFRSAFRDALQDDFPHIPPPPDANSFWELVSLGGRLRSAHLLTDPALSLRHYTPTGAGDWVVTKVEFVESEEGLGNVWVNNAQYFNSVPLEAFEFQTGGYCPASQWLKDRKNRQLSFSELLSYQRVIESLRVTSEVMDELGILTDWIND